MKHLVLAVALCGSGCGIFVDMAVDRAMTTAADRVGERVGEAIAARLLANNPALLQAYTLSVFGALFYQGGYWYEGFETYEPGQYTRWATKGVEEGGVFERTLLARQEDGREWWRVETRTKSDEGEDVVIMEALLSEADESGQRRILRMRAQLPGNTEPTEVPVQENAQGWQIYGGYALTAESMEGMKKGTESLQTPAGVFETTRLEVSAAGTVTWWQSSQVPGGLVKYQVKDGSEVQGFELIEYGSGRTASVLGAF